MDNDKNVLVVGRVGGNFYGQTFSGGSYNAFLMKINENNVVQWAKLIGTNGDETAYGGKLKCDLKNLRNRLISHLFHTVSSDFSNSVYITGYVTGSINGATAVGGGDIMVIKYLSDGTHQFTKIFGSTSTDSASSGELFRDF